MKLLLDANISWRLISALAEHFEECRHVDNIGLNVPAKDIEIWRYALDNDFIIVTHDEDFYHLMDIHGFPPKVVLLRTGNCNRKNIFSLLVNAKRMIEDLYWKNYGLLELR